MSEIAQAITNRQNEIDRLQAEIKALTDVEHILGASAPTARSTGPPWTGRSVHGAVQASSRYSETWMVSQLPRCAIDSVRADRRLPASISRAGISLRRRGT